MTQTRGGAITFGTSPFYFVYKNQHSQINNITERLL
jgi:hypothetical protein